MPCIFLMTVRMPSLNGLKAFESAARHMSFTRAAEELNVTQTAVSHRIRRLEDELGVRLFLRLKDGLALTTEGQAYLPGVKCAFEQLRQCTEALWEPNRSSTLTISTLVSLASKWLLPRLASFQEEHPNIDVRVSASTDLVDFRCGGVDAAIRYGNGYWPGLRADWLMSDEVFPVCSPLLLNSAHPIREPRDLVNHTLLQVSGMTGSDWNDWLQAARVEGELKKSSRLTFDLAIMAVQAAVNGMGVCIGRTSYVESDLKSGALVEPFTLRLKSTLGFYLVSPLEYAESRKITAFRTWLVKTIQHPSLPRQAS
ncbi:Glycine cleavage system transcriptional activator [compost metagenome]